MVGSVGCLWLAHQASAGETQPGLAETVRRIDWDRFSGEITPSAELKLSSQILANSVRWGHHWLATAYEESPAGDRFVVPIIEGTSHEHSIRPATSAAVGLAAAIRTGVADSSSTGVSKDELIRETTKLIKGVAAIHKTNGGQWGNHWQSSLWASQLCRAGWMMWDDLDAEAREMVCRVCVYEADRHIKKDYRVPYWNGKGGDSKAEENSWESVILHAAVAMMPKHPNVDKWKRVCSELQISAYARKSDMNRTEPILDGKSPKQWLRGYNVREDGIVINHNLVHPDYMTCIASSQMHGFSTFSLAGVPVPETTDFNFDLIYKTLIEKRFDRPPNWKPGEKMYIPGKRREVQYREYDQGSNEKPGRTMYAPGRAEVYYPQGTDWSLLFLHIHYNMDIYAAVLKYDDKRAEMAKEWIRLRCEKILAMQSRHADGHMYAEGEFDRYPGREQMVLWKLGDSYLFLWLAARDALSEKANWLEPPGG